MSSKFINTRIKQKRDTEANWQSKNPVLLNGEIVLVDMNDGGLRAKIGNGSSTYDLLPFTDEPLRNLVKSADEKADSVAKSIAELVGDETVSSQIDTKLAAAGVHNIIHVGPNAPTNSSIQLWIDPSDTLPNFEEVRF